jgi:hypothetical protein
MKTLTNSLEQQINDAFELIDDTVYKSMYVRSEQYESKQFCEIKKICKKNNLLLEISDSYVRGHLVDGKNTDFVDFSIILAEPCCLDHALQLLTEKFLEVTEEIYGEIPETRTYYLEGLSIESISEDSINIVVETGT